CARRLFAGRMEPGQSHWAVLFGCDGRGTHGSSAAPPATATVGACHARDRWLWHILELIRHRHSQATDRTQNVQVARSSNLPVARIWHAPSAVQPDSSEAEGTLATGTTSCGSRRIAQDYGYRDEAYLKLKSIASFQPALPENDHLPH